MKISKYIILTLILSSCATRIKDVPAPSVDPSKVAGSTHKIKDSALVITEKAKETDTHLNEAQISAMGLSQLIKALKEGLE